MIKKAYAQLLRKYRPDEQPEQFQEINQAYLFALNVVDISTQVAPESRTVVFGVQSNTNQQTRSTSEPFSICEARVNELLSGKNHVVNQLKKWSIVDDLMVEMSIEDRDRMAELVFQKCYDVNYTNLQKEGVILIHVKTLQYLNSVFHWTDKWNDYQHMFRPHCFRMNFDLIEGVSDYDINSFSVAPWRRMVALLADVAVVFFICYLILSWIKIPHEFGGYLCSFIMYQLISETLFKQGTLGSRIFKYRLVNMSYMTPNLKQTALRLLYFHVMLSPMYLIIMAPGYWSLKWLILSCILYPVWVLMFLFGKRFVHDEMSWTKAISIA